MRKEGHKYNQKMKPILQTERLQLIPFEFDDLELLHHTFTDPFVRRFLWDNETIAIEKTKEILFINEQQFENYNWGLWKVIIRSSKSYIGFTGLWLFFNEDQPQLLYALLPNQTGFGYATEASKAIIEYAFNKLNFKYLFASFDTPNEASRKVCERLKMEKAEEKEIGGNPVTFYRIESSNHAQ